MKFPHLGINPFFGWKILYKEEIKNEKLENEVSFQGFQLSEARKKNR
jgi:hypothetical protein